MKKPVTAVLQFLPLTVAGMVSIAAAVWNPVYVYRLIFWDRLDADALDHFPARTIRSPDRHSDLTVKLDRNRIKSLFTQAIFHRRGVPHLVVDLEKFLISNGTESLIVMQDGAISYEGYFNRSRRATPAPLFELGRALLSALVGIAIAEGHIGGVGDPIGAYLPELANRNVGAVTIRDLLAMTSGIRYRDGRLFSYFDLPWTDGPKIDYGTDLRRLALRVVAAAPPRMDFQLNDYHALLLGLILERTTGRAVSAYLEEKIWRPLGMEYDAAWSLDSPTHGFERMNAGLSARPVDLLRFGQLILNKGIWDARTVVPAFWISASTAPSGASIDEDTGIFHKFLWWGQKREDGTHDIFALGRHGQVLYISPSRHLIIVRTGSRTGDVDSWSEFFFNIAGSIKRPAKHH